MGVVDVEVDVDVWLYSYCNVEYRVQYSLLSSKYFSFSFFTYPVKWMDSGFVPVAGAGARLGWY